MADQWRDSVNGVEDDDEALRLAIALSLEQDPNESSHEDVDRDDVTVDGGTNDGNQGPQKTAIASDSSLTPALDAPVTDPRTALGYLNTLGAERAKMEKERLARKRKVGESPECTADSLVPRPAQRRRQDDRDKCPPVGDDSRSATGLGSSRTSASTANIKPGNGRLPFPKGVVKKTWAYGHPRNGDDIKIEEVLQQSSLELAVLSSYQWDDEWIMSKVDSRRTKIYLVAFSANEVQVRGDHVHPIPTFKVQVMLGAEHQSPNSSISTGTKYGRECASQYPFLFSSHERRGQYALEAAAPEVSGLPPYCCAHWEPNAL